MAIFLAPLPVRGQAVPQFRQFPAGKVFQGHSAAPKLSDTTAYLFRTRLREATKGPVNFAGHYHLAVWGCGTSCTTGAVVDALSGQITFLPFSVCCHDPDLVDDGWKSIEVRPESRLIVFSGLRNEEPPDGTHFYTFDGSGFHFLRTLAVSKPNAKLSAEPTIRQTSNASADQASGAHAESGAYPKEVLSAISEANQGCPEQSGLQSGFVTRRDINGDGIDDFILDYGRLQCGDRSREYCGSAGCLTQVFASGPNGSYKKVLDENVQDIEFKVLRKRPAMLLFLHGSACGKIGSEPCHATLFWNGEKFSPAH